MENIDAVLEDTVNSSDDKTSQNEQLSQPSEIEQLKAIIKAKDNEILKFKDMADRRGNQLKKMKDLSNESEDKTSEKVDTTPLATETKSANNTNSVENSDELNAVKEQLFRVQHPEITNEDMGVLKSINADYNAAYDNVAFQSYLESQKTLRANASATISQESGINIQQDLSNELDNVDRGELSNYIIANAHKFFN